MKLSDFSTDLADDLRAGRSVAVEDAHNDPRYADLLGNFAAIGTFSFIVVPLMKGGRLSAMMSVNSLQPHEWQEGDLALLATVANRCWESIERSSVVLELQAEKDALLAKTAEAERQRAEIESIYRTAPIGLALFDLDDYHYLRLNDRQAAFFGLKPEDVVGKTLIQMAPIEGLRELFDQVAAGTPVINYPLEGTLINAPDEYRYWTVSYFPVRNDAGEITGITAASLEITPQKKAELALIQSEKLAAVGRLAASIAHEINNPLEAVTNLLYLATHSTEYKEIQRFLHQADTELRRMSAITSQTLRFHRQSTNPTQASAKELFESTLGIYHARLMSARTKVVLQIRNDGSVRCFEGEIRQVLANLIGNALDAMPFGGRLHLRAREGALWKTGRRGLVLTVADDGPGIPAKLRQRIFDPFFTTKGVNGTGLGLWVSQEIVQRHGGELRVRSRSHSSSHGTVFTLFLPFDAVVR